MDIPLPPPGFTVCHVYRPQSVGVVHHFLLAGVLLPGQRTQHHCSGGVGGVGGGGWFFVGVWAFLQHDVAVASAHDWQVLERTEREQRENRERTEREQRENRERVERH